MGAAALLALIRTEPTCYDWNKVIMVFVHETAVVDEGAKIGDGCKVWHWSHICASATLGVNCTIGQNVYVGPNVSIGNNVKIQNNVSVYSGVSLADNVFVGPSVVFTNVKFPRSEYPADGNFVETTVLAGATIGANSTIICGIDIGRYAFVGAGSVVTKSIADFAIVYGNPAKFISFLDKNALHQ